MLDVFDDIGWLVSDCVSFLCNGQGMFSLPRSTQAVALGGRAAEELFVGKISTGASDDLDKAAIGGSELSQ